MSSKCGSLVPPSVLKREACLDARGRVVIVGAGHGGVQAAASLRENGFQGAITLVSDDSHPPYQRPPLSKAFMNGDASASALMLRGPTWYSAQEIELRLGERVVALDRPGRRVFLETGYDIAYEHLILAPGAEARAAPFPGAALEGVYTLRNLADAERLRSELATARHIVVVGAGFVGLEFAATAALKGRSVQVVEIAPRVMARAVSPMLSAFYALAHQAIGIQLHLGVSVSAIEEANDRACAVRLSDGRALPADIVVLGIGIVANQRLAAAAGLAVGDGVIVDELMRTSDPAVSAVGDCAAHFNAFAGRRLRLESVQNALDQARVAAHAIVGGGEPYKALPWFWSDQADLKLQIAGFADRCDTFVVRGKLEDRKFSIFGFNSGKLCAVESVNRPADHMLARQLISSATTLSPEEVADPSFDPRIRTNSTRNVRGAQERS